MFIVTHNDTVNIHTGYPLCSGCEWGDNLRLFHRQKTWCTDCSHKAAKSPTCFTVNTITHTNKCTIVAFSIINIYIQLHLLTHLGAFCLHTLLANSEQCISQITVHFLAHALWMQARALPNGVWGQHAIRQNFCAHMLMCLHPKCWFLGQAMRCQLSTQRR